MSRNCVLVLKNCLYWTLGIIFLTVPLALLFLWKCIVTITGKLLYPNWASFNAQDGMTLGDVPNIYEKPLLNIGFILKVDTSEISVTQFREHFYKSLLEPVDSITGNPVNINLFYFIRTFCGYAFKQKIKLRDLNINELITEVDESEDLINSFFYSPYEKGKPLWNIGICNNNNLNDQRSSTLLFRLHHSIGDGYSLIYLFEQLATGQKLPIIKKSFNETFLEKVMLFALAPTTLEDFKKSTNVITNPLKISGVNKEMEYVCFSLDLESIKIIRKKSGAAVTSILLTLLGGAIRRLLLETKRVACEEHLPANIYSACPLPWPDHPRNKMCNEWTIGMFKVPIINPNPMERLMETDKDYKRFHSEGINILFRRLLIPVISLVPIPFLSKVNDGDLQFSTSWSSIVAGNNYRLLGNKISHIYPFVGMTVPKMAITVISLSQTKRIDVTLGISKELSQDGVISQRIVNEFVPQELLTLEQIFEI